MKTNLFNTNYSAPEMKVIEVELEGMLCGSNPVNAVGLTDFNSTNTVKQDDWE